ncbi:hypothetical protein LCGC14_2117640 [marine sediment metagenome]|uniref:Uncharacterized protein n=1 Tax=marine sediment metagenome TaxID=412755 RepID=A0A0F9H1F2_9ZZZZ
MKAGQETVIVNTVANAEIENGIMRRIIQQNLDEGQTLKTVGDALPSVDIVNTIDKDTLNYIMDGGKIVSGTPVLSYSSNRPNCTACGDKGPKPCPACKGAPQ